MSLGLTSQEAQIYVYFAQNNSDKKQEVMRQLEIGEQELIDSIQRLTKKGFMKTKRKESDIFSVIPLQIVMDRLIIEKLREVQKIKGEINENDLI
jgi:sugar-specific transcriptional regulator TrmB